MKDIFIRNADEKSISVNVVRFFRLNSVEYLIFSSNEIDDGGYVKLYVSKIIDGIGQTIEDDVEWNLIKDTIKTIIKSNKDNLPLPITDIDSNKINNIQISDQKVFKLNDSLLSLLTANQTKEVMQEQNSDQTLENNDTQIIYQTVPIDSMTVDFGSSNSVENPVYNGLTEIAGLNISPEPVIEKIESSNNSPVFNNATSEYALDYKTLYDNEIKKNEEMKNEIEKYKTVIEQLRKILNSYE